MNLNKITLVSLLLSFLLMACQEREEVRVMPEFNYDQTAVDLYKNEGSTATALIYTTEDQVLAEYSSEWLTVDVNVHRAVYTTTAVNETGEPRSTLVKLTAGGITYEVTVTQLYREADEDTRLKVGQLTADGLGMIFWVDPSDPESGKAISLQRWGGNPFEAAPMGHDALSAVDGPANTAKFTNTSPNDAAALCVALGEGWYLPASGELLDLFAAYNGVGHTEQGFTNDVPANISASEKAARARFDQYLTDLGGEVINAAAESGNGESYWSSTESSSNPEQARYIRFGKYTMDVGAKSGTARFVRAMKVIGNYQFPEEPATISVDPKQLSLESDLGATATATVTTNKSNYIVIIEGDGSSWLTSGQVDKVVTFTTLSQNDTGDVRTATVSITAGSGSNTATTTLTVSQQKAITFQPFVVGEFVNTDGGVALAEGGVVFWVDPTDPAKAKIISLQRESLKWSTGITTGLGVTDSNTGQANTETIANSAHAADIPAIQYCAARGAGWYWPARNELIALYDAYNSGRFTAAVPNDLTAAEKAARAAFDKVLTDNGGVALNTMAGNENGDSYWASTETSTGTNGFYVRFGRYGDLNGAKTGERLVRCVRNVSK